MVNLLTKGKAMTEWDIMMTEIAGRLGADLRQAPGHIQWVRDGSVVASITYYTRVGGWKVYLQGSPVNGKTGEASELVRELWASLRA